jgi:hypothetical protein
MGKQFAVMAMAALCAGWLWAGSITDNITDPNWTIGTNPPQVLNGVRGDGTSGPYHHLPLGTSAYYWSGSGDPQGSVTFWVYDPSNCLSNPAPTGVPDRGPQWGMMNPGYQCGTAGIARRYDAGGCMGYKMWSSVTPSDYAWFKDGPRASENVPWSAGWYKWKVTGTYDNISWTLYNVTYWVTDGAGHGGETAPVVGDCSVTWDATTAGGIWLNLFGNGFTAFYLNGDDVAGLEDISVQVVEGDGLFSDVVPVARPFHNTTWGNLKALYR